MTEHILPDDLANGLVDGAAAAGTAPGTFHGAAELLDAMRAPATPDELVGMAAFVQQFSASVTSSHAAPAAHRTGVVHMLTARITKRAAAMAAVTLLAAGTAAAAAGGVIPTPFVSSADDSATTISVSVPGSSADDSATSTSVDGAVTSTSVDDSATSSSVADSGLFPHDAHDQCEDVQKGLASAADTAALAAQAASMGVSVADYCMLADAAHDANDDHGSGGHGADDAAGDDHGSGGHGADDAAGDDHGSGSHGGGHGADDAPGTSSPSVTTPSGGTTDDSGKGKGKGKGSDDAAPVTTTASSSPVTSTPSTTPGSGTVKDSGSGKGKGKGGDDTSNG